MKKLVALILALMMAFTLVAYGEEGGKTYNLAWCMSDMSNVVLSDVSQKVQAMAEADGNTFMMLSADGDSATQIQQVEDCLTQGVDAIMLHAVNANPDPLLDVTTSAREKGVGIFAYDFDLPTANVTYLIKDFDLGHAIGASCAEWVNGKYADEEVVKIGILNIDSASNLVSRKEGIIAAIEELIPNAEIVSDVMATNLEEAMSGTENMFQANPDIKAVCCIGDTLGIGANEVLTALDYNPEDIGVFAADATADFIQRIVDGEFCKCTVAIGSVQLIADEIYSYLIKIADGEYDDEQFVHWRSFDPVTIDNYQEYI